METGDDIFTLPSSQQPTQKRYISQRSMMSQSQRSQTQNKQRIARNYFENILMNCAVVLDNLECYIMGMYLLGMLCRRLKLIPSIEIDHITFVCKLRHELQSGSNQKRNVDEFLAGLESAMSVNGSLLKLLSGCKVTLTPTGVAKLSQESLIKDFMMVEFLEKELIRIIFKKISKLAAENT